MIWRQWKVQGYYGSWLPFLLELSTIARNFALRVSSREAAFAKGVPNPTSLSSQRHSGMAIPSQQLDFAARISRKRAKSLNCDLTAFSCQTLFGRGQTFAHHFQIVIAIAKFDYQFGQGDQMFHLKAQGPPAPAAHFFQFPPLLFRHTDVELERFLRHARSVPDRIFELMRKYD